jgi:hypothetical protein
MSEVDWRTELENYNNISGQSNDQFQFSLSDYNK